MKTYLISHQKPDLDSITCTLAYTEFLLTPQGKDPSLGQIISTRCDSINNETSYVLSKFKIPPPALINETVIKPQDQIILLDHNEESQRMKGLNQDQIISIIDHHMAKISLPKPIRIDIRPWGSTSTIIYNYYKERSILPQVKTLRLLLCAILSDTLGLKSSTTTPEDQKTVNEIVLKLNLSKNDLKTLTFEIFKAKSNISNLTPPQILTNDYKVFNFPKKTFVGQVETVEPQIVLKQKPQLLNAMKKVKKQENIDLIFLAITDILKENTKLIYLGDEEKEVLKKAFGSRGEANVLDIGHRLSRKKEIAPPVEKALSS